MQSDGHSSTESADTLKHRRVQQESTDHQTGQTAKSVLSFSSYLLEEEVVEAIAAPDPALRVHVCDKGEHAVARLLIIVVLPNSQTAKQP